MLHVLMSALLLVGPEAQQRGIITGTVIAPQRQEISGPVQVVLLAPRYLDLWQSEVQRRLDRYWQQYQPTFRNRKELFSEFSRQAHKDATNYILARMIRDSSSNVTKYLTETSTDGTFEFRNIPFGEYKVLAFGKIDHHDTIWQELVNVHSAIPYFLELKRRVP